MVRKIRLNWDSDSRIENLVVRKNGVRIDKSPEELLMWIKYQLGMDLNTCKEMPLEYIECTLKVLK